MYIMQLFIFLFHSTSKVFKCIVSEVRYSSMMISVYDKWVILHRERTLIIGDVDIVITKFTLSQLE